MHSCASNNGLLSKDAPYLNALSSQTCKSQMDSPYFKPFYNVCTESVKKNIKLLFSVVQFVEASLTLNLGEGNSSCKVLKGLLMTLVACFCRILVKDCVMPLMKERIA